MNRLNYMVSQLVEKVSVLSLLNYLLLLAIVLVAWVLLLPAQNQLADIQQQPQPHQQSQSPKVEAEHVEQQFLQQIPEVEEVSHAVESLFTLAQEQGLVLHEVRYKDELKAGEPVLRYNIDFNLLGDYLSIKQFLSELLVAEPYLALQQVGFERENVEQNDINAQFKMSLFLR